jgi:hypothetical protein
VAVAHLALDLGLGHQCRDRVDDQQVDGTGPDQHVGDLQRLLSGVGLGDEQRVGVDAELLSVFGVERVLGVDERGDAASALGVGHRVQGDRRLAGGLGAVDLDDATARESADAEGDVERDGTGRDHLDGRTDLIAQSHDGALAKLTLDLSERGLERLLAVVSCHGSPLEGCGLNRLPESYGVPPTFLEGHATSDGMFNIAERLFDRSPMASRVPRARRTGLPG